MLGDHEEAVVILEELVDTGSGRVVDAFELVDLALEQFSLVAADLVLVDDVDCTGESGLAVDRFPQLIELIVFEARREQFVLGLDAPLDLPDEVGLLELQLSLLLDHLRRCLLFAPSTGSVSHYRTIYIDPS